MNKPRRPWAMYWPSDSRLGSPCDEVGARASAARSSNPHHHLWLRAGKRLHVCRPAGRHADRPQHRRHGVSSTNCHSMYPTRRPFRAALGSRDRVRHGVAAMTASGGPLRQTCAPARLDDHGPTCGWAPKPRLRVRLPQSAAVQRPLRRQSATRPASTRTTPAHPSTRTATDPGLMADKTWRSGFAVSSPIAAHLRQSDLTIRISPRSATLPLPSRHLDRCSICRGPLGYASYASRHDEVFATLEEIDGRLARRPKRHRHVCGSACEWAGSTSTHGPRRPARRYCPTHSARGRNLRKTVRPSSAVESQLPVDKLSSGYGVAVERLSAAGGKGLAPRMVACFSSGTASRV